MSVLKELTIGLLVSLVLLFIFDSLFDMSRVYIVMLLVAPITYVLVRVHTVSDRFKLEVDGYPGRFVDYFFRIYLKLLIEMFVLCFGMIFALSRVDVMDGSNAQTVQEITLLSAQISLVLVTIVVWYRYIGLYIGYRIALANEEETD